MAGVDSVTVVAPDATPAVAPNKISNRAGHTTATVAIALSPLATPYGAVRVTAGARNLPAQVMRGIVCGMGQRAGALQSLRASTLVVNDDVRYDEMNSLPDGDYNMAVYIWTDDGVF